MFLQGKKLLNLPVAAMATQSKVGTVRKILVDPQGGRLIGFLVQQGFLAPGRVLSHHDVVSYDPQGLVVNDPTNLLPIDDIVRAKEVMDQRIYILGMRAYTESGKFLGRVTDFVLSTDIAMVVKYHVVGILGLRILPAEKVVEISKKGVIFSDDVEEATVRGVAAEPA